MKVFELSSYQLWIILEKKTQDASNMAFPMNTYQHWIRRTVISSLKLHHGSIEQWVALLNSNQNNLIFESQWCSRMCCYAISEIIGNIRVSSIPQRDRIRSVKIISSSRHNRHNIIIVRTKGWTCSKLKHGSLPKSMQLGRSKQSLLLTKYASRAQCTSQHCSIVVVTPLSRWLPIMTTYFDTLRTVRRSIVVNM